MAFKTGNCNCTGILHLYCVSNSTGAIEQHVVRTEHCKLTSRTYSGQSLVRQYSAIYLAVPVATCLIS